MPLLEELSLIVNSLVNMPDGAFNGLKQLKILRLDSNTLTTVSAAWWSQMPALEELRLANNKIETLADGILNGLNQLKTLDLSSNRLHTISAVLFQNMPNLESLYIHQNQLECDCRLAWLRVTSILRYTPFCASPPSVKDSPVVAYDISMCVITTTEPGNSFIVLISQLLVYVIVSFCDFFI